MSSLSKEKGFVIFDTATRQYYCKSNWSTNLSDAFVFSSIDELKEKYKYFEYHPEYLVRHRIKECDLVYRAVTIKVKSENRLDLLKDV